MKTDTIAAIATGMTDSGIGIIRVSGEDAVSVVDKIYRSGKGNKTLSDYKNHTIHHGFIYEGESLLDEVMVVKMLRPKSYTMEDTVEIQCHGGVLVMRKILEAVLKNGARMAEPGEFTKRAFLNGRIDLAKAEAVMDMIHSRNEFALKSSVKQLKGLVSDKIAALRASIIYEIAHIESALDDPEHYSMEGYYQELTVKVDGLLEELKLLIDSADNGRILKEGINTVIVGKPNVGKSSLLNLLVGEEKAIVTEIAGTTRDALEEHIMLHGIGLNIIDTAGIRSTQDIVEKIGVERARSYASDADLILYVVDASVSLDESDSEIFEMIRNKKAIVLLNKTDLEAVVTEEDILERSDQKLCVIKTSAKNNTGIDDFEAVLKEMFFQGEITSEKEIVITNLRHKEAIQDAYSSLLMVKDSLMAGMPEDFLSIDFMSAYSSLGYVIGEEVGEDLVNEIFSRFCMGK